MSKIGRLPIVISNGVKVNVAQEEKLLIVTIEGPKGKITKKFANVVKLEKDGNSITVTPIDADNDFHRVMTGTVRSIVNSMVIGVEKMFFMDLVITGPGYRAITDGKFLNLSLGKSHGTKIAIPSEIQVTCPKLSEIKLASVNKESIGAFAKTIIAERPVNKYKGNGIYKQGTLVLKKRVKKG